VNQFAQREREFDEVLRLVEGLKEEIGVTRLADITCLDNIGIPVYCSYRPRAFLLQANAGKGVSHEQAKCSAMMEALEYKHFEQLPDGMIVAHGSHGDLSVDRSDVLSYDDLGASVSPFYSHGLPLNWVKIQNILNGAHHICPVDLIYLCNRSYVTVNTNGLASGNTNQEATLHSIYEIVERDAYAQILVGGKLDIRSVGKSIRLSSIEDETIKELVDKISASGSQLYLILLPSSIAVYSFWAIIIDEYSLMPVGSFNMGLGCHAHPVVAAVRAITEAAQTRLVYIHGNREDIRHKAVFSKGFSVKASIPRFFKSLERFNFYDLCLETSPCFSASVEVSLSLVIEQLAKCGFNGIYTHVLRDESRTFSVVKTIIPGMRLETRFV
jgi:ribosomal protein S12 methylthiotransferase accessory factor